MKLFVHFELYVNLNYCKNVILSYLNNFLKFLVARVTPHPIFALYCCTIHCNFWVGFKPLSGWGVVLFNSFKLKILLYLGGGYIFDLKFSTTKVRSKNRKLTVKVVLAFDRWGG